jgi:hypothetical protein
MNGPLPGAMFPLNHGLLKFVGHKSLSRPVAIRYSSAMHSNQVGALRI